MSDDVDVLDRMSEICLSLPDTKLTMTWGKPHFRVGERIFAGCGEHAGWQALGFKLTREHADAVMRDPRFRRAPYVGHQGWVQLDGSKVRDWAEVRALVLESYGLIAPKRSLAKLAAGAAAPRAGRRAKVSAGPRRRTRGK